MQTQFEIINSHAHIYPQKIAEKATSAVGTFYDIEMDIKSGTTDELLERGKKIGVSKYVVHSCATTPHQVRAINDFIFSEMQKHPEFIGFMTLHPALTFEEIKTEIEYCVEKGFKGIKLHPDFQKFYVDGAEAENIYRAVSELKKVFPILLHIGDKRYDFSEPKRLVKMAKKYPDVTFISAHFGGYQCWDNYSVYLGLKNVYFDTCSSLYFIGEEKAKTIIDALGYERFFFADDFPMWDVSDEYQRFMKIPLSNSQRQAIFSGNIKKLLKL